MIPESLFDRNLRSLLAPVAPLLSQPEIAEVIINGPWAVYVERRGRLERTECRFATRDDLMAAVVGIAQYAGRNVGPEMPILEARLPDGSRVEAVVPPAAPDGPLLNIRRFAKHHLGFEQLIAHGSLDRRTADMLRSMVRERRNILVAGGTGSGKTSLLNALSESIPPEQRIVVIEDARELALPHQHVVYLQARPPDARGRGQITVRQLFGATLRLRPDRIVLGEIRHAEALDLVQALTSGHGGCLATVHATSPRDVLARLETMALMSDVELPLWALRAQIASGVDIIVQTARSDDGRRRVHDVAEVDHDDAGYHLTRLDPQGTSVPDEEESP